MDVSANSTLFPTVVPRVVLVTFSMTTIDATGLQLSLLLTTINDDTEHGGCEYSSDQLNEM